MGRWDSYPVVDGSKTDGLSGEREKKRIIFYIAVGAIILFGGLLIYYMLNKTTLDNPYSKRDTGFKMNKSLYAKEKEEESSISDEQLVDHKIEYTVDNPNELMLSYNTGDSLQGYAGCLECDEGELTTAKYFFYSNGTDSFFNDLANEYDAVCIDPGLEPPHDGRNRPKTKAFNGKEVGQGRGNEWWYDLTDYGYTAVLTKTGDLYDWCVTVNFDYGAYHEEAQRMQFHIKYNGGNSNENQVDK